MNEFITRCCHADKKYKVIIDPASEDHYKMAENFTWKLINQAKQSLEQAYPAGTRPWIDARPSSQRKNGRPILTAGAIEGAMQKLNNRTHPQRYIYKTNARGKGKTLLYIMEYFRGSGVVVQDGDGNLWLNGEPYQNII